MLTDKPLKKVEANRLECSEVSMHQINAANFCLMTSIWKIFDFTSSHRRDRIVVSTLRCGRNNPGSNPGHGKLLISSYQFRVINFTISK